MASDGKVMRAASGEVATPFLTGAGEMNPTLASDPGLIYDLELDDFANFLCSVGYNDTQINAIMGGCNIPRPAFTTCQGGADQQMKPSDLNLPSLSIDLIAKAKAKVMRRVTNVGSGRSIYTVSIKPPMGTKVEVKPSKLSFTRTRESQTFVVKISRHHGSSFKQSYSFGSLTWSDGLGHNVRSPIVAKFY